MADPLDLTVQSLPNEDVTGGGVELLSFMNRGSGLLPQWWSRGRDKFLRQAATEINYLSSVVYAMTTKVSNIPLVITPQIENVDAYQRRADQVLENLELNSDFYKGWRKLVQKYVTDLLCQDNGAFMEVIGPGNPAGPIMGAPLMLASLDSSRCVRTGNALFPVLYRDVDGSLYKLHRTRVITDSQQSSTQAEMHGVGLCAVSRSFDIAQSLHDFVIYKQEELGSRPARQMLVGSNISARSIVEAFEQTESSSDARGLSRFSRTVVVGKAHGVASVERVRLGNTIEGFNQRDDTMLGIYAIAMGFGVDAREIWPVSESGASKADAQVQHLKSLGKGFGDIRNSIIHAIQSQFLPYWPRLTIALDMRDDQQDHLGAQIGEMRARQRHRDMSTGAIDNRTSRLQMLRAGEITRDEFEELELKGGRLPSGEEIACLFFSPPDSLTAQLLNLGVPNILLLEKDDGVLNEILNRQAASLSLMTDSRYGKIARRCHAALQWLFDRLNPVETEGPDTPRGLPTREIMGSIQPATVSLDGEVL